MSPEEKHLLEQTFRLAEENNLLLKKMRRSAFIGQVFHVAYWVLIIAISFGAYYVIQPYFSSVASYTSTLVNLLKTSSSISGSGTGTSAAPSTPTSSTSAAVKFLENLHQ